MQAGRKEYISVSITKKQISLFHNVNTSFKHISETTSMTTVIAFKYHFLKNRTYLDVLYNKD